MQVSLLAVFTIIVIHFIGDFVCQSHWQAVKKSTDNEALSQHVLTYSICWLIPMAALFYCEPYNLFGAIALSIAFSFVTYVTHWITDYFTSRLNSKLWAKEACKEPELRRPHNFFVAIGFDQALHFIQLFTTFCILKTI